MAAALDDASQLWGELSAEEAAAPAAELIVPEPAAMAVALQPAVETAVQPAAGPAAAAAQTQNQALPTAGDWLWLYATFGGCEYELQLDPHTPVRGQLDAPAAASPSQTTKCREQHD